MGYLDKLKETGWQSWSFKKNSLIKFPRHNYPPYKYEYVDFKIEEVKLKKPVIGWCSWPEYGTDINADKIHRQVSWIKKHIELNLKYILLDDGWTKWGDWNELDTIKFPEGLKNLVKKIEDNNLIPGIWIAPFLVQTDADIVKEHPEWLVINEGKRVVDGLKFINIPGNTFKRYLLDTTKLEVREYISNVIDKLVGEYGFKLLKLDFLYAPYFNPNIKAGDAEKFLHKFLLDIKKKYPDVYTIGCGCPLNPALGVVDSMRIAEDNSIAMGVPKYINPIISMIYANRYIKHLVNNYKEREWTREYWNLDLDTFVIDKKHGFNNKQLLLLRNLIKEANGNIFLGDDLTKLTSEEVEKYIYPLTHS